MKLLVRDERTTTMTTTQRIAELEKRVATLEFENEQLKQELAEAKNPTPEVSNLEQAKENFLNLITHEIRTPLTSVNGALEILTDATVGDLNPVQREFVQMALANTRRLIGLMETAFEITQLETGQLKLHRTKVELNEVVNRVLNGGLREGFTKKEISLNLDFAGVPMVYADYRRLLQVFENLLSNACKFTPVGGTVTIISEPTSDGRASVSIMDTGIGLSLSEQRNMFEKFYRADYSYTRNIGGLGLGLNVTRSLVKLHGSELHLETMPGRGSCFTFHLNRP
jgi:signal transduction histidine kinase